MSLSMYGASAPLFLQTLKGLSVVLAKGDALVRHKRLDESVVLGLRTWPDMFPLSRQVWGVAMYAQQGMANLAGATPPEMTGEDRTFAELRARVDQAIDYVSAFLPEDIDGSEEREVRLESPLGTFDFTGERYLINVVIPNILFHAATAYNLLRGLGVDIGKMDFVGRTTV